MDLGLSGRKAIVCASSRGLGRACALALAAEGCEVVVNGRDAAALAATVDDIRRAGGRAIGVAADVGTAEGRAALIAACPAPDILVNNNGGPPPKDFRQMTQAEMAAGVAANMLTPIALVQGVIDGMIARRFGRIIDITSASVKMPMIGLDLSSGARAGLTAFLAGVARQVAEHNVTINHILPGGFMTERLQKGTEAQARIAGVAADELMARRRQTIPARRYGEPEEFGKLCAFLASDHAGYITGQSILIDGGMFNSAF